MTTQSQDVDEWAGTWSRLRGSATKLTCTFLVAALLMAACTGSEEAGRVAATPTSGEQDASPVPGEPDPSMTVSASAASGPVPLDSIGAEARDADGFVVKVVTMPAGTYRADEYPDPITFTTTSDMALFLRNLSISPEAGDSEFDQVLIVGQPAEVVDLSEPSTFVEIPDGPPNVPPENLIEVPEDVGAWLGGAETLSVIREGSTTVDGMPTSWWDVEVATFDTACFEPQSGPPCQILWPDGEDGRGGVAAMAFGRTENRIWAIPGPKVTTLVMAQAPRVGDDAPPWLDEAGAIVESMTFQ